jgi:hypothetical protein
LKKKCFKDSPWNKRLIVASPSAKTTMTSYQGVASVYQKIGKNKNLKQGLLHYIPQCNEFVVLYLSMKCASCKVVQGARILDNSFSAWRG